MACLVGKFRQTVPTPTPARRAISSIGAFSPDSASTSERGRQHPLAVAAGIDPLLALADLAVHGPPAAARIAA